jgi:hypothetical protein
MLISLILLAIQLVYTKAGGISAKEISENCSDLDYLARSYVMNDLDEMEDDSEFIRSILECDPSDMNPNTVTLAAEEGHVKILKVLLHHGVPVIEPDLVIRYLIELGSYDIIPLVVQKSNSLSTGMKIAILDAIDSLGYPKRPSSLGLWTLDVETLSSILFGNLISKGWVRVLLNLAEGPEYVFAAHIEYSIKRVRDMLTLKEMEKVFAKALIYKNECMIRRIENYWPDILWKRIQPIIIRQTMDSWLLTSIIRHGNPYTPMMATFDNAYVARDEPITGIHQVSLRYWKAVGYILNSNIEKFKMFWEELKRLPMAEDNYYIVLIRAAGLAKERIIFRHLLENPPNEFELSMPMKLHIAKQLLPLPQTIEWLGFRSLVPVYCELMDSNDTYHTRLKLLKYMDKALQVEKPGYTLKISPHCYEQLQKSKALNTVSKLTETYAAIQIGALKLSPIEFDLKFFVEGNFFHHLREFWLDPASLYFYLVKHEALHFMHGAVASSLVDIVVLVATAFLLKRRNFAFQLMKTFNVPKDKVLTLAESRNWTSITQDYSLKIWGEFQ